MSERCLLSTSEAEIKCNLSFHVIQNLDILLERELCLLQLTQYYSPLWNKCNPGCASWSRSGFYTRVLGILALIQQLELICAVHRSTIAAGTQAGLRRSLWPLQTLLCFEEFIYIYILFFFLYVTVNCNIVQFLVLSQWLEENFICLFPTYVRDRNKSLRDKQNLTGSSPCLHFRAGRLAADICSRQAALAGGYNINPITNQKLAVPLSEVSLLLLLLLLYFS